MSWRHLSPLSRKLLRDLWTARGQALAIAVVVAAGISMFTAYLSCFDSLARTRDAFYQRQRLADVFANLVRAPRSLEPRIAEIPGVVTVETRVMAEVTLDLPDLPEPASGRLVSLPHRGPARLNELKLRRGSWPNPSRPDEVLVGEAFANAHRLEPGASLAAILNGRRRELRVVGIALSAEYVYTLRPGELIPDDRRYGVLWMDREALGAAFDLEGGFNEVSLHLAPGASSEEAIRRLDRLLEPFGGRGAIPSSLQPSVWMVDNELDQLATMAVILPSIFLLVAAVVLNIALSRALSLQRTQIAALKALGYHNREIAAHYRAWGLLIAGGGALAGLALGAAIGQSFLTMYNDYFRFPELAYRLSPWLVLAALALSLSTAWLGARRAVRKAVSVPPAEAMRPQAPERFRPTLLERLGAGRFLAPMTRMVLRNLARQPGRAASSIAGIALGGAIVFVGLTFLDSIQLMIDHQFQLSQRQDATVVLTEPRSPAALKALAALPGVLAVEPQR
nr:ABC transporter permease [Thermoanaerobaculia bacterium]